MTIWILKYSLFFAVFSGICFYLYFRTHEKKDRKYGTPVLISATLLFFIGLFIGVANNEGIIDAFLVPGSFIKILAFGTILISTFILILLSPFFVWRKWYFTKKDKVHNPEIESKSRRSFLRNFGKSIPVVAASTALTGSASASGNAYLREQKYNYENLNEALHNFTIVQFSDVHLGTFITPKHIKDTVDSVNNKYKDNVDLVVLTGDIADDFELLDESLTYIKKLNPKYGIYASIGNHEIFRGREEAISIWKSHGVKYLCDEGTFVDIGNSKIFIAGLDDPGRLHGNMHPFLSKSAKLAYRKCIIGQHDSIFKLTLSHRPEGFDAAQEYGSKLTLSGHTHGMQLGFMNKSLFSLFMPKRYLLGRYQKNDSFLYTSAGLGHWFPLRFGCPCEINLHILEKA